MDFDLVAILNAIRLKREHSVHRDSPVVVGEIGMVELVVLVDNLSEFAFGLGDKALHNIDDEFTRPAGVVMGPDIVLPAEGNFDFQPCFLSVRISWRQSYEDGRSCCHSQWDSTKNPSTISEVMRPSDKDST